MEVYKGAGQDASTWKMRFACVQMRIDRLLERLRTGDAFRPLLVHTSLLPSLYSLFILACNRRQSLLVFRRPPPPPPLLFFFFLPPPLYTPPFIRFRCQLNVLNRETTVNGFVEETVLLETVLHSLMHVCVYVYKRIYISSWKGNKSDEFENRDVAVVDSKNEGIFSSFFFFFLLMDNPFMRFMRFLLPLLRQCF